MLANGLGFLALFSLLSFMLGDDSRPGRHPTDDPWFWTNRFGR